MKTCSICGKEYNPEFYGTKNNLLRIAGYDPIRKPAICVNCFLTAKEVLQRMVEGNWYRRKQ